MNLGNRFFLIEVLSNSAFHLSDIDLVEDPQWFLLSQNAALNPQDH